MHDLVDIERCPVCGKPRTTNRHGYRRKTCGASACVQALVCTPDTLAKRNASIRDSRTPELRAQIGRALQGHPVTTASRRKASNTHRARYVRDPTDSHRVRQYLLSDLGRQLGVTNRRARRTFIEFALHRDGYGCGLCGVKLEDVYDGQVVQIEHDLPVSLGGTNDLTNLRLVHATCNRRRSANPHASLPEDTSCESR